MKYLYQGILLGLGIFIISVFCNTIYNMGYMSGSIEKDNHLYAIKKRTIINNNILKYPFTDSRRAETETGGGDSLQRSGTPETEKTPEQ